MSIKEIILDNNILTVSVLNLGATIFRIIVPTRENKKIDVVLGLENKEQYTDNNVYFGATIGRCTNRIENAQFTLNGKKHFLTANANPHHIHGGVNNLTSKFFDVIEQSSTHVVLETVSRDGEDGYPGDLTFRVTYKLQGSQLHILYDAVCNQDTILNVTNHAYFNLNGEGAVLKHSVVSPATMVCHNNPLGIPEGAFPVANTPFDFTTQKTIDVFQRNPHPQTEMFNGYDNHYFVPGSGYRHMISVKGEISQIQLDVFSTQEGFQFFTSNFMPEIAGKNGETYFPHCAFCVEAQTVPNAINRPFNCTPVLLAGENYFQKTVFAFTK